MSEPPCIKGQGLNSFVSTLAKGQRADLIERFHAALSEEARPYAKDRNQASAWFPARVHYEMLQAAHVHVYGGDLQGVFELGRNILRRDLSSIYRGLMKILAPEFTIARSATMWSTYFKNNGSMHAELIEPRLVHVTLTGIVQANDVFWHHQRGSITGVIEATRFRCVGVDIISLGDDGGTCVYAGRWA